MALVEGLTSTEAGDKYKCNKTSLLKIGAKYKFPKLKTDSYKRIKTQISKMTDGQLLSYKATLDLHKNLECSKSERQAVDDIISERKLKP